MRKKKIPWYQNPYQRFLVLLGILVVLIIICAIMMRQQDNAASSEAVMTREASASGDGVSDSLFADPAAQTGEYPETGTGEAAGNTESAGITPDADGNAAGTASAAPSADGTLAAETADGTGAAGIMPMGADLLASSAETGWHFNDYYTWYSTSPGLCYYGGWQEIDGLTYHFDQAGHLDLGWKLVGGTPCYFDDSGVYQPGADNSRLLAFTFDDGPSEGTDALLDLCSQTGARVTFFMIGKQVEGGGAVIPYILKYRCQLGNHSYSHADMYKKTVAECVEEFEKCDQLIRQYSGGIGADVVRFPYGDLTDEQVAAVGKASIFWDVDTFDWETRDVASIKQEVYDTISEGNLILMHDRYPESVEACRQLFPELIAQGYQLVTVSELAAAKGIDLAANGGVTYYNFRG